MKIGDELKLRNGGNVYLIERIDGSHLLLKCVWFSEKEDLGDEIFCTHDGQEIWVALYHAQHYELISDEKS